MRVYNKTERETDRKTEEVKGRLSLDEEMSSNQNKKKAYLVTNKKGTNKNLETIKKFLSMINIRA